MTQKHPRDRPIPTIYPRHDLHVPTHPDERQRDQDVVPERADERWNNEDHYTNKSGDPRIGTHGRAYEPGEKRR